MGKLGGLREAGGGWPGRDSYHPLLFSASLATSPGGSWGVWQVVSEILRGSLRHSEMIRPVLGEAKEAKEGKEVKDAMEGKEAKGAKAKDAKAPTEAKGQAKAKEAKGPAKAKDASLLANYVPYR